VQETRRWQGLEKYHRDALKSARARNGMGPRGHMQDRRREQREKNNRKHKGKTENAKARAKRRKRDPEAGEYHEDFGGQIKRMTDMH
jgi:hypothetical protein